MVKYLFCEVIIRPLLDKNKLRWMLVLWIIYIMVPFTKKKKNKKKEQKIYLMVKFWIRRVELISKEILGGQ